MANVMGGNTLVIDTVGTTSAFAGRVRLIQWVDDNGDIVDDSTLVLSINGDDDYWKASNGSERKSVPCGMADRAIQPRNLYVWKRDDHGDGNAAYLDGLGENHVYH